MPVPCELSRPLTRKASTKTSEVFEQDVKDDSDSKSKVLVRGRIFDDSKPETFNQVCILTALFTNHENTHT